MSKVINLLQRQDQDETGTLAGSAFCRYYTVMLFCYFLCYGQPYTGR